MHGAFRSYNDPYSIPKESRGSFKNALFGIFAVVILIFILAMVITQSIAEIAKNQFVALQKGDFEKAYSLTAKTYQRATTLEQFKRTLEKQPVFFDVRSILKFDQHKIDGDLAYLQGTVTLLDKKWIIEYQLVKENSVWKILGVKLSTKEVAAISSAAPKAVVNPSTPPINTTETPSITDANTTTQTTINQAPVATVTNAPPSTPPTNHFAPTPVAEAEPSIHAILVSDAADEGSYVNNSKTIIPANAKQIFATVQVIAPKDGFSVSTMLTHIDTQSTLGPATGEVTKTGHVLKSFSFSRGTKTWPLGDYQVVVTLSTGDTKTFKFVIVPASKKTSP